MPLIALDLFNESSPSYPVLTAEAMREADRTAIEDVGVPSFTLMESAARAAAFHIEKYFGPIAGRSVRVLCGKGNNGGDGLALARTLYAAGARVHVVAISGPDAMSDDAARNARILERIAEHDEDALLRLDHFDNLRQLAAFPPPDLFVDALLGTGLTSNLREPLLGLVQWLNEQPQPTVALDLPTGLHTDLGTKLGATVRASLTVTMGSLKTGLLLNDGPLHAGRVAVAQIGIPGFALEAVRRAHDGCAVLPTDTLVRQWLPRRARDAYKYSVGLALVVGGSPGMTGAPVMASLAAARAGAGYVQCACHEGIAPTLLTKLTEVTTLSLPGEKEGIDPEPALDALSERLAKAQALLVGPGLGRNPRTQAFVRRLLETANLPVVIDADGLNALADEPDFITDHAGGRWVLTPHTGEFNRLTVDEADLTDRIRTARRYAEHWNAVLLLKGTPAVVAAPDGTVYVNPTGNAALATAGTGDVLAGIITGLLAQGLSPVHAAVCALYVGGAAADQYACHHHPGSMMATDLLDLLPYVLLERFSADA